MKEGLIQILKDFGWIFLIVIAAHVWAFVWKQDVAGVVAWGIVGWLVASRSSQNRREERILNAVSHLILIERITQKRKAREQSESKSN